MPTFEELALHTNCPVIRSKRSDDAILIATRVPLDDIRLERWGWVLTVIPRDGRSDQNDIETLHDNAGRQFPKVYVQSDMQNYIERWTCGEWEEGYQQNGHYGLNGNHANPAPQVLEEDVLKPLLAEMQESQAKEIAALKEEVRTQLETTRKEIAESNVQFHQTLSEQTIEAYNKGLERARLTIESVGQDAINQAAKYSEVVEEQSRATREESSKNALLLTEEVKNQSALSERHTLEAIEAQFRMSRTDTAEHLQREHEEIKNSLTSFTVELKELQEQIKLALAELDPTLDEETDQTQQNATDNTNATKIARKVTTQIERITLGHQKMSMSYYNSANQQSQQAFKYAWFLGFTAIGLFCFFVIASVFMAFLQLYGYAVLLGSIGGVATAIVTVMGLISSAYAKTTKQFALAQKLLDRSYRPTIANAICIGYSDEDRKQGAFDKIVDNLLTNEAVEKV